MRNLFVLTLICLLTLSASIFGMKKWGKACREVNAEIECLEAFEKNPGRIIEGALGMSMASIFGKEAWYKAGREVHTETECSRQALEQNPAKVIKVALGIGDMSTYYDCVSRFIKRVNLTIPVEILQKIGEYFPEVESWEEDVRPEPRKQPWWGGDNSKFRFITFSPQGTFVLSKNESSNYFQVRRREDDTVVREIPSRPIKIPSRLKVTDLPEKTLLSEEKIVVYSSPLNSKKKEVYIHIYPIEGKKKRRVELKEKDVTDVSLTKNNKLYVCNGNGILKIYNATSGVELARRKLKRDCWREEPFRKQPFVKIVQSSDEAKCAIFGQFDDHKHLGRSDLFLSSLKDDKKDEFRNILKHWCIPWYRNKLITWHPDNQHLIFGTRFNQIGIFDAKNLTDEKYITIPVSEKNQLRCIVCSPNGKTAIVLSAREVIIFDDILNTNMYRTLKKPKACIKDIAACIKDIAWLKENRLLVAFEDGIFSEYVYTGPFCSNNPLKDAYQYYKTQKQKTMKDITYSIEDLKQLCVCVLDNEELCPRKVEILLPYIRHCFGDNHPLVEKFKMLLEEYHQHVLEYST